VFQQRGGPAVGHDGDTRAAVLAVLAEGPMHGAQVIRAIEERSHGMWQPTPGSVYPTLQLLADEGLVTGDTAAGRRTYSLTEAGRAAAQAGPGATSPWDAPGASGAARAGAIPKAALLLAQATAHVARTGSPEQVAQAAAALDEARRTLYSILARS
jgi:hypothetical protein